MREANEWLERYRAFWESSFDALDRVLDDMKKQERERGKKR
jgi:hypothetical protein